MSKGTYPLKLPASIKAAAERLAKQDGVSLNQWIAVAVAQKVSAVEMAADFFKRRAEGARADDLITLLAGGPNVRPEPGDEVPDQVDERPATRSAKKPRIADTPTKRARRR